MKRSQLDQLLDRLDELTFHVKQQSIRLENVELGIDELICDIRDKEEIVSYKEIFNDVEEESGV